MNYLAASYEVSTACNFCCQHNWNLFLAAIRIYENLCNANTNDLWALILTIDLNRLSSRPIKPLTLRFRLKTRPKPLFSRDEDL
jgi:hypothetical protein